MLSTAMFKFQILKFMWVCPKKKEKGCAFSILLLLSFVLGKLNMSPLLLR